MRCKPTSNYVIYNKLNILFKFYPWKFFWKLTMASVRVFMHIPEATLAPCWSTPCKVVVGTEEGEVCLLASEEPAFENVGEVRGLK